MMGLQHGSLKGRCYPFMLWLFLLSLLFGSFVFLIEWKHRKTPIVLLDNKSLRTPATSINVGATQESMKIDYKTIYTTAILIPEKTLLVEARVSRILQNKNAYLEVERKAQVPWWCVAAIHSLECSLDFKCHLHNGDSLASRTWRTPKGRPVNPPENGRYYEWWESAADALSNVWKPVMWNQWGCLAFLEEYNGLGYRAHSVYSPYLWACTSYYSTGLYTADGKFSPLAVSNNIGAAALLKVMEKRGAVSWDAP